jgi:hypothetical protein
LRFRLETPLDPDGLTDLGRALGAARLGATLTAESDVGNYLVDGVEPDATLVAALAAWCATGHRLIREMRTAGGTLEEIYLELVHGAGGEAS